MDFLMGWSVITRMGLAWKYYLNLREATIKANDFFDFQVTEFYPLKSLANVVNRELFLVFFLNQACAYCHS